MTPDAVVEALVASVPATDPRAAAAAAERHDRLVKPPGSLGRLEEVGVALAAIAGNCPPPVPARPRVVVAAADHGVHARGVTAWPQQITTVMVEQFCTGTAAVNALARTVGAEVVVLDVGCAIEPADHPLLRKRRVRPGTDDLSVRDAMSTQEATRAFLAGADVAAELVADGVDLVVTGDMGIANTTASACLIGALTGSDAAAVTGRGAGADDRTMVRKRRIVQAALGRVRERTTDVVAVLAAVGGLEHAALAGLMCRAAADRVPVLLDGVATAAAALVTTAWCPAAAAYLLAGHRSTEPAASVALDALGLTPLLDLRLRLGEGTGGLLAVPLVIAAARVLSDMATLDALDVG